jgi:hypothetical protein
MSLVALIGWCRWRGIPQDQKDEASPGAEGKKTAKRKTLSL